MESKELIPALRLDAEWAHSNEWETPIMLGDHLDAAADALAAYEDTGLTPEEIAHAKDLLAAEKDGRLVTLPVGKIGDVVEWDSGVCKELFQIRGIVIYCDGTRYDLGEFMPVVTNEHICRIIPRAEAKAALNESNSTSLKPEAANG